MQEEHQSLHECIDPLTQTRFSLKEGRLIAESKDGIVETWPISNIKDEVGKHPSRTYLKFAKNNNSHILLDPTSTLLTCKSDRIQEVEANKSYSSGKVWWQIYVPHTLLFLTVGIKDKNTKSYFSFDYSLKFSARLAFKLDLEALTFKSWINGVMSESKLPINIEPGTWTPFVRLREVGSTISFNAFISDPEQIASDFNLFNLNSTEQYKQNQNLSEERVFSVQTNTSLSKLFLTSNNTIIFTGEKQIKVIRRNELNNKFSLQNSLQLESIKDKYFYSVFISSNDYNLLKLVDKKQSFFILGGIFKESNDKYWLSKSKEQWVIWGNAISNILDRQLKSSSSLPLSIYEIIIRIFQQLRIILGDIKLSLLNRSDKILADAINKHSFSEMTKYTHQITTSDLFINNYPTLVFPEPFINTSWTNNYVYFSFPNNKISVLSVRGVPIKIGDFILSKAIKKEHEITQYQREAEQIKNNDLTKPSIYKILKNCLKYADKVKPPEKLVKQLEIKRTQIKQKQKQKVVTPKNEIIPDKSLQSTLIQMGFDARIARKALIECKNSSLQAAMDLIITQQVKIEQDKKIIPKSQWTCQTCTLVNNKDALICIACDTPVSVAEQIYQKIQQKPEEIKEVQKIEDIQSQKIQQELKTVYAFETDVALCPMIIAGVFQSKIRFRLFSINPRFYSYFYEKEQAYVDLTNNCIKQFGHELTTCNVEQIAFTYFSQSELKQKCFSWIPVQDNDVSISKEITGIQFGKIQWRNQSLIIRATIKTVQNSKDIFFKLDTSKVFSEKQRSFTIITQQILIKKQIIAEPTQKQINSKHYPNTNSISVQNALIQFNSYFMNEQVKPIQIDIVDAVHEEKATSGKSIIPLYVAKSSQFINSYPHISFYSPWQKGFNSKSQYKNGLIFSNLNGKSILFEALSLQIAGKQDKLTGYFYFANDYQLLPLKKYRFVFDGTNKKLNISAGNVQAQYLVLVLEPNQKIVQLSYITAYGQLIDRIRENPNQLSITLPTDSLSFVLNHKTGENQSKIKTNFECESYLINSKYDLSIVDSSVRNSYLINNQCSDILVTIKIPQYTTESNISTVTLSKIQIKQFAYIKTDINTNILPEQSNPELLKRQFNQIIETYLIAFDQSLLQKIISNQYSAFKEDLASKNFTSYINDYLIIAPFDRKIKSTIQIFIKYFADILKKHKQTLNLSLLIKQGLQSHKLTANGLELLLLLNKQTAAVSSGQLANVALNSLKEIAQWKATNKEPYSPYQQKSLFSSHIHNLLSNQEDSALDNGSIDRIYSRILLTKYKFSRRYVIDLFSCYQIRAIQLYFQKSQTKNKFAINLKWLNSLGQTQSQIHKSYDYSVWNQLVHQQLKQQKYRQNSQGYLTLPLPSKPILSRYLIVEINFTLRQFNATKYQIQNLAENEIIPFVYGKYVGDQQTIQAFSLRQDKSKYLKKIANLTKFSLSGSGRQIFLYEEQDKQQRQVVNIEQISKKLQLKENRQKMVQYLLKKATRENIDFHFTLLAVIIEQLIKSNPAELIINQQMMQLLINTIINHEAGPLQQLSLKFIKVFVSSKSQQFKIILKQCLSDNHINYLFKKQNPLASSEGKSYISQQIKNGNKYLVSNVTCLIKMWQGESDDVLKRIGSEIISFYKNIGKYQQIGIICSKLGWVQGTSEIVSELSKKPDSSSAVKNIIKAGKQSELIQFVLKQLNKTAPSEVTWTLINELASKCNSHNQKIDDVFSALLVWIGRFDEEEDGQISILPLIEKILKIQNKFILGDQVAAQLIKLYFNFDNRQSLLGQFMKLNLINTQSSLKVLFDFVLTQVQTFVKSQRKKKSMRIKINLQFLLDILAFVFNHQKNNQSSNIIPAVTVNRVLDILVVFLPTFLNLGGSEGCRFIGVDMANKLALSFYLIQVIKNVQISASHIEPLLEWYIINLNSIEIQTDSYVQKKETIHASVQALLIKCFTSVESAAIASKIFKNVIEKAYKMENSFLSIQYQTKVNKIISKLIKQEESNPKLTPFISYMLKEQQIFDQILNQIVAVKTFESPENPILNERELANNLNMLNQQKPKDWLVNKHGAKNHVHQIQFSEGSKQFKKLQFQGDFPLWASQITIAFECGATAKGEVIHAPQDISVETGDDLVNMKFLGKLQPVSLKLYQSFSVKVYSINLHHIRKTFIEGRNHLCKFIRINIKSPYKLSSSSYSENSTNFISYINFLSIQGFMQNGLANPPSNMGPLVDIIADLNSPRYKTLLSELLTKSSTISCFKASLINISYLMSNQSYSKHLHHFLLRVCQLNSQVGSQMLDSYMQLKNPQLCSKIAAEVVLSNLKLSDSRLKKYFDFIVAHISTCNDQQLVPFISKFIQIVSTLRKSAKMSIHKYFTQINLTINQVLIHNILQKAQTNRIYLKLAKLFLSEIQPVFFKGCDLTKILEQLFISKSKVYRELIGCLITSSKPCREWFVNKDYLGSMFKEILSKIQENTNISSITDTLQFLGLICQNSELKNTITKKQYDLQIFEILISKKSQSLLSNENNKQFRKRLVQFIAKASLGSQNQKIIGALLKDSLNSLVLEGSQQFISQIFLPLLNSFSKSTVSITLFNQKEQKILLDLSNIAPVAKTQKIELKSQQKYRLFSNILSEQQKVQFFLKVKQESNYRWGVFNLATNHGKFSTIKNLSAVKTLISNQKQSLLIIISTKKTKLGVYYNAENQDNIIHSNTLNFSKGSFLFQVQNKNLKSFGRINKNSAQKLIAIETVDSSQNNQQSLLQQSIFLRYRSKILAQIHYGSVNSSFCYPELLQSDSIGTKDYIESIQYWSFDPNSIQSYESVFVNDSKFTAKLLSQLDDLDVFPKQLKADKQLQLLRFDNLFEFPSSITVKELKSAIQVMGCKINDQKLKNLNLSQLDGLKLNDSITLQQIIRSKNHQDMVVQLLIDFDCAADGLQVKKSNVQFLPKKGILKYFEENAGVETMIKVIKKSIGQWKNVVRKQKWLQYVTQLQKFSSFPHFFSVYLKDKQTFAMLMNLLSGLPDKQADTKWDDLEASSSQKLLKIIEQILKMDQSNQFRNYALKNDFIVTILQRLRLLTGMFKRKYEQQVIVEQQTSSPSKNQVDDDGVKKIKKKKGVGYGNDTNSNTKWMKGENLANIKKEFENVQTILNMVESFLNIKGWNVPNLLLQQILESALLPYTEDCLRAGTLLEVSKHPQKFKSILKLIRSFCNHQKLVICLLPLKINYQPSQIESIQSLLKLLYSTSKIFISCLNQNLSKEDKLSQQLATDIIQTYTMVQDFIEESKDSGNADKNEKELQHILELPLDKKYRQLLKDLRFDYIDMKESPSKIKHHYSSNFAANYTPNHNKMIRLAQQLADISTALPYEHTNAVYVRCDKDRVDFMQALIMGSNGTPYGHGAFLFDVYFDDNYPNGPPKVNLTTTGHGKIRFNPNLYSCGKVCLSLLGTWRGSASENWDPKVSTLLQVLLSIQAIIMSEQIYFNEPGFEHEQGTEQGEKKNQAYSNIVRYGNVKFAMLQNIKNPPKGFESIIRRHFYLKKDEIMQECKRWIKYAEKRPANYIGLVNDHNVSWAAQFKKTKTQYKEMLEKAVKQLQEELEKLSAPKISDIVPKIVTKKQKKKKQQQTTAMENLQKVKHEEIDVSYENKHKITEGKELDINDQKVKDRWSRYIGAMGIDAVSKQSKADILVIGLGPFALEVVKNLVLSGCRKLTICEQGQIQREDLSGGFFYQQEDIGKKKIESILYKIRELNSYVKIDSLKKQQLNETIIHSYTIVLVTDMNFKEQTKISKICKAKNIKFISADCKSAYCRLINDFGQFTVLDKNGEEPVEVMLKNIQISEKGVVTLLDGVKHPFEDGQVVFINHVEGMDNKEEEGKSINGTLHTIKVLNFKSFEIGNTLRYKDYVRNGTAKNIKTPVNIKFRPFEEAIDPENKDLQVQSNLQFYDFTKLTHAKLIHLCFIVLDQYLHQNALYPKAWNLKDAEEFINIFKSYWKEPLEQKEINLIKQFSMTCKGFLPPLCAFFGGLVAQQIIKGITQKFKPINSTLYLQFSQIIPKKVQGQWSQEQVQKIYTPKETRNEGFAIVVGRQLCSNVAEAKLFMIGAGAIGCELLKNFAMVGLGTGSQGKIVLTDPDHIENSNLNRQFLFRQKHISKPKSLTAAASILLMNSQLKGHITPLLERVSDATKEIFSNQFFGSLTIVANALDNVAARRYVDQRCVENKIPLFESGTLGPKGHVQVIIPYLTESYGSQNDPVQEGEIPHCTLKLFPEETLHCVEWARDIFGKKFTLQPKALGKFLQKGYKPEPDDIKSLNESLRMVTFGPHNFEDCLQYAIIKFYKYFRDDIMQLMYTYPLNAKTKNGQPFWRLPKRPPTPIKQFDRENSLHCTFVVSMAVLLAKIYDLPFPKDFRTEQVRLEIGKQASKLKIHQFVPSDEKAKAILQETVAEQKKKEAKQEEKQIEKEQVQIQINTKNENQLINQIITESGAEFVIKSLQFEKDDDSNGHIDFIYAMANLRSHNYKLDPMDWITTKLKAGRIIPALATTTSCVAGLQTLQICKYIQKIKIAQMRNSYLNLAVPSLQMSEPGQVKKTKITETVTVTLWDRWEIECKEDITFGQVYDRLKQKYGLFPKGILQGMSRIDSQKGEAEKKQYLKSLVLDKLQREEGCVDVVVLFTLKEEDDKILEGIPPVRLRFGKK